MPAEIEALGPSPSIAFLDDDLMVISNGNPLESFIYDIATKRVLRRGVTCVAASQFLWVTGSGLLLAGCNQGLVIYNRDFQKLAAFPATGKILLSPTHELVMVMQKVGESDGVLLKADTLAEITRFPAVKDHVIDVFRTGYMTYESKKNSGQWSLLFHEFSGGTRPFLSNESGCMPGFGISETEFVKIACAKQAEEIVSVVAGNAKHVAIGQESKWAELAVPSFSGRTFVLAGPDFTRAHTIRTALNPLTIIEGLGGCCEETANLMRVQVFDQDSGRLRLQLHFRLNKEEPLWGKYYDQISGVALSPNGRYLGITRKGTIEVHRVPD